MVRLKGDHQVVLFIAFALMGFWLGLMTKVAKVGPIAAGLITPLVTLAAAFGGSWYASKLHDEKSRRESDAADVKAANSTIFELARWRNVLHAIRKQFIDEHRNHKWRHLFIMPAAGWAVGSPQIDYDRMAFLIRAKDPNILGRVTQAELEIKSVLDVIQQRSAMHVEYAQPAAERIERRHGGSAAPEDVEREMGPRNAKVMRMLTDFMISGVDDALLAIDHCVGELHKEVKAMYPGHAVIGLGPVAR